MDPKLLEIQNLLRDNGIIICFSGRLSQGLIEECGEAVKNYLEQEDRPLNQVSKVFSTFIEQTQNINNYTASKKGTAHFDKISNSSIVSIGKENDSYFIVSGNVIECGDLTPLTDKLEQLQKLDKDGLKRLYKEKLAQDLPPDSSGAGVGLIEMARKVSRPLQYSVTEYTQQLSFFTLKAFI